MDIFSYALTNALLAGLLGLLIVVMVRPHKYPRAARVLWLLVLVKLLLPPLVPLSLPEGWRMESAAAAIASLDAPTVVPTEHAQSIYNDRITLPLPALLDEPDSLVTVDPIASPGIVTEGRDKSWLPLDEVGPPSSAEVPIDAGFTNANASLDASQLALGIWFAGSALWLLIVGARVIRFERWLQRAGSSPTPATSARLSIMIEDAADRLQLRRLPGVVVVPGNVPPLVWPIGRGGRVIVPAELIDALSPSELRLVLAHELAHLKRRDHWVRWFEAAVTGLYWWHPVVWLARRELRTAEEIGCDQLVLRVFSPSWPATYGEALVKTSDFVTTCSRASYAMASGFVRPSPLKRRIEMIVRPATTNSRRRRVATLAAFAAALALLPLSIDFAPGQELADEIDAQLGESIAEPADTPAQATDVEGDSFDFFIGLGEQPEQSLGEQPADGAQASGDAPRAAGKPFADPNRVERYLRARTLADAIEICHAELRANGKGEYVALVNEDRMLAAIRTAMQSYEASSQQAIADHPDDPVASQTYAYYRRAIRPKLEQLLQERKWPKNSYFDPIPALVDERGVRYDGLLLRLTMETPGDESDGFGLPVLDVMYGRFARRAPRDERSTAAADSFTVRKLRIRIEALRTALAAEEATLTQMLKINGRTPGAVTAAVINEQRARLAAAKSELDVSMLSLEEAQEAAKSATDASNELRTPTTTSDATDAALDAVIRRSEAAESDATDPTATPATFDQPSGPNDLFINAVNGRLMLVHDKPISRVQVSNPEVVSVETVAPTHVQLTGKALGITQITLFDADGNSKTFDVRIGVGRGQPYRLGMSTTRSGTGATLGDPTSGFGSSQRGSGFGDSSGGIGSSLGGLGSTTGGRRGSGASGVGSTGLSGLANRNGARASGNNEARLRLMREYVEFMQQQLKSVEAKHKAGVPGGEAQSVAQAGFQLNRARAELFEAMGNAREARQARDVAVEYAQRAFDAAQAEYATGRVTQDRLFQAREQLLKAKLEALSAPSATRPAGTAIPR